MANTNVVTSQKVTRRAAAILHGKLNMLTNVNQELVKGEFNGKDKIGTTVDVRLPNQFTSRVGSATWNPSPLDEKTSKLSLQYFGVDLEQSIVETTLKLEDIESRILEPAMAKLAATIEGTYVQEAYKGASRILDGSAGAASLSTLLNSRKILQDELAGVNDRNILLGPKANIDVLSDTKGLFQDATQIAKQYREGMLGRVSGFDVYENLYLTPFTTGAFTTGVTSGTILDGATASVFSVAPALNVGDVFTFAGVFRVHPETKAVTTELAQFTVTSTSGTTVNFAPAIYSTGARQNVSALPASGAVTTKVTEAGMSNTSLAFQKDFAVFATADLMIPKGVHHASRSTYDNISMRYVEDYDSTEDRIKCRFDVFAGFKVIQPQLGVKIWTA